jgi:hypothetical protein
MSQEWLNGLSTLCIEKRLLNKIDIDTIIDDFASRNVRRKFWDNLICIQIISYEYYFCIQLLIVTFCIYVYIYCQWVLLVVLSCSYKEAQNFRFVLGQRKLRTGPGYKPRTHHQRPHASHHTASSIVNCFFFLSSDPQLDRLSFAALLPTDTEILPAS